MDAGTVLVRGLRAPGQAGHKSQGHVPGERAWPKAVLLESLSSALVSRLPLPWAWCRVIASLVLVSRWTGTPAGKPCLGQPSVVLLFSLCRHLHRLFWDPASALGWSHHPQHSTPGCAPFAPQDEPRRDPGGDTGCFSTSEDGTVEGPC